MKFTVRLNIVSPGTFVGVVEMRDITADHAADAISIVAQRSALAYGFTPQAIINAKAERSDLPPRTSAVEVKG